ncbi:hypothetical protein [Prolixibacter bellariivorans]|nr:hypothetical protein [Prolixibacter bellariivorans]
MVDNILNSLFAKKADIKKGPQSTWGPCVSYRFYSDNTLPVDPLIEAEIIKPVIKAIVLKSIHYLSFSLVVKVKLNNLKKQMLFPFGMKICDDFNSKVT